MATGNIISAEIIPNFNPISLKTSVIDAPTACGENNDVVFYIPDGFSFATTTVIWALPDGTGIPIESFYSDADIARQWNGIATLGVPINCTVSTPIELGYNLDGNTSCTAPPTPYFIDQPNTFATANLLTTDAGLLNNAIAGFYGDGIVRREWDGGAFIGSVNCNVISIPLGFDVGSANAACVAITSTMYLHPGLFSYDRAKLWTNAGASIVAPIGYYSDSSQGNTSRYWDGTEFTTEEPCSEVIQLKFLPFDNTVSNADICAVIDAPYFLPPGQTFSTATSIWTDGIGTVADDGLYNDGAGNTREFRGSAFIGPIYGCSIALDLSANVELSACNGNDFQAFFLFPLGETLATATDMYAQWITGVGAGVPTGVPDAATWYADLPTATLGTPVRFWTDDISKFTTNNVCPAP